jgi:hypothetical protein
MQAMSLGAADFAASMGMQTTGIGGTQANYYMLHEGARHYSDPWHWAQAAIVSACRTHGVLPVDGPFGDFSDDEGYRAQARRSATLGMVGKWAIHPKQVALANEVFTPSEAAVTEAREILAAMEEAKAERRGRDRLQGAAGRHRLDQAGRGDRDPGRDDRRKLLSGRAHASSGWVASCIRLPRASSYRPVGDGRGQDDGLWRRSQMNYLDFEKPLAEIEGKAEELRALARQNSEMDVEQEAAALDKKADDLLRDLYKSLTPWRKCQVARHPDRPHCSDYIDALFTEFTPLAGDRNFADDHAVMGGLARFDDPPVVVIGHEKGHDTKAGSNAISAWRAPRATARRSA